MSSCADALCWEMQSIPRLATCRLLGDAGRFKGISMEQVSVADWEE